jgi:REP element-mobilizing transposase RayT
MGHPPRIPVLIGLNQSVIYFVTFCVDGRRHVLDNDDAFAAFRQAITRLDWHIIAAVVMPDHVHLLAGPRHRDAAVGSLSAAIKRTIRKRLRLIGNGNPGVSIAYYGEKNRPRKNGNIYGKIRSAPA